jgi:FMN phosphatase YigB (HAD superfamily)
MNEPRVFPDKESLIEAVKTSVVSPASRSEVLFIDYFDTLVTRTIAPEQTKVVAAHQLAHLMTRVEGSLLYQMRRHLEMKLCRESQVEGKDEEFALPDLAERLYRVLSLLLKDGWWPAGSDRFVDRLCCIELAVEKRVQRPIPEMVDLLGWLKGRGIPVYIVSDFYLPGNLFSEMVAHHALSNLVAGLFVSADDRRTKGSGALYHEVCHALGVAPRQVLMIGDNHHADGAMACAAGLQAFICRPRAQTENISQKIVSFQPSTMVENELCRELEAIINKTSVPFKEMGATLWWFTAYLFAHLRENNVRQVFFCSKEGEFLKLLFERYQQIRFDGLVVDAHYLIVSRKATFIGSLRPLGEESFERLFDQYRDLSLEEFVQSLNFTSVQLDLLKEKLRVDWVTRLPDLRNREEFFMLLSVPLFRQMYEEQRISQRRNLRSYLASFGVDFSENGLHMVDVGWKGSIQNNIYHALDRKTHILGYYVGLLSPTELAPNNAKKGILFSDYPNHSDYVHVFNNNRSLFEMMLGASHGSADGYFRRNEWAAAGSQRTAHINRWVGESDSVGVATCDLPEERRLFQEQIEPLQRSFLETFEAITEVVMIKGKTLPPREWVARQHARMCFYPTRAEVEFFARLYHLENFGIFEFTRFSEERKPTIRQRIHNFQMLRRDPQAILETGVWQPVIFRRLGLPWLQRLDGFKRHRRIFSG